MRKIVALAVVAGLCIVGFAGPAQAKKAKPVVTTLFLHGSAPLGEGDSNAANNEFQPMDTAEPEGGQDKSKQITNYLVGPNVQCAGNTLFPVWSGTVKGKIVGDMKLTFSAAGTPGTVLIRVWPDIAEGPLCNEMMPEPAGEVEASLPAGEGTVEAVIPKVNFTAKSTLMVQVSPVILVDIPDPGGSLLSPFFARILYDSTASPSSLEFTCIPKGKTCA
jgi:hypothetical protein